MNYTDVKGDRILLGPYTLAERNEYINRKTLEYLLRHPTVNIRYAKRQARIRWSRKVKQEGVTHGAIKVSATEIAST